MRLLQVAAARAEDGVHGLDRAALWELEFLNFYHGIEAARMALERLTTGLRPACQDC